MSNVPALLEKALGSTIEGACGIPVTLTTPDGTVIDKTVDGRPLKGYVRKSYSITLEHGEKQIVNSPVVVLRITSLQDLPESGKNWLIGIPSSPLDGAETEWYNLNPKMSVEANSLRGTVKLYLAKMQTS